MHGLYIIYHYSGGSRPRPHTSRAEVWRGPGIGRRKGWEEWGGRGHRKGVEVDGGV